MIHKKSKIKNLKHINYLLIFLVLQIHAGDYFTLADDLIDFTHDNGHLERFNYPEIVGSGVGLLDVDNDGDLDLYLVQSGSFNNNLKSHKFYKNLFSESHYLKFIDETKKMMLENFNYGIGIATTDFNNDGWVDFFLTNLHKNQLFINQGDGQFKTIDIGKDTFSSSSSFCDINNDGFEDLYVSNYVNWSRSNNPKCFNKSSAQDYCGPDSFAGVSDEFYLNVNGQKLVKSTKKYFPQMPNYPGLNVTCQDVDNDGWMDFIVANDGKENLLWLNQKGKVFKESGLFSGIAVNAMGVAEASMGMAIADYDLDNDMDVFFTHLMNESNTLYQNNGKGHFRDVSNRTKLTKPSMAYTGWAAGFLAVNNDIYPDLLVFNGAVSNNDLKQANQLYLNSQSQKFTTITKQAWLKQKMISRGAAFGDLDNDGDIDVVINNNNGKATILLNNLNPNQWMGIKINQQNHKKISISLYNSQSNKKMRLNNRSDGSYASAHDTRVVINQAQLMSFDKVLIFENNRKLTEIPLKNHNKYIEIELK